MEVHWFWESDKYEIVTDDLIPRTNVLQNDLYYIENQSNISDIDEEIEKFKCDPLIQKSFGEKDIEAQIRNDNTYKSEVRAKKQAILEE
jgi:hypothetical protein